MGDLRSAFRCVEAGWEYFDEDRIICLDGDELYWLAIKTKLYYSILRIDIGSKGLIFTVGLVKYYHKKDIQ